MDRTRRVIIKPARYNSTSSEEEPRKRAKGVSDNIEEVHGILQAAMEGVDAEAHREGDALRYEDHSYISDYQIRYQPPTAFGPPNTFHAQNAFQPPMSTYAQHSGVLSNVGSSRVQQNQTSGFEEVLQLMQHFHYEEKRAWQERFNAQDRRLEEQKQMLQEQKQMLQEQKQMLQEQKQSLQQISEQQLQMMHQQRQLKKIPKPACLPLCSPSAVQEFDNIDEDGYRTVINYLVFLGGNTVKEAVTLSFKDLFDDNVVTSYSWLGREEGKMCLGETRAAVAIQDAVLQNRRFPRPSKKEIGDSVKIALRTAKERVRSRLLGPRTRQQQVMRTLWPEQELSFLLH